MGKLLPLSFASFSSAAGGTPPGEAARRVRRYRLPRRLSYDAYDALGQRRVHPTAEVRVREEYATNLLDAVITELATDPLTQDATNRRSLWSGLAIGQAHCA